jgi:D-glycero-D-manno-heptose 1,7-bisphosphate phosphatase
MLIGLDIDGTLVSSYMDRPDRAYDRWEVLPGRIEKLRELIDAGDEICLITNQAGVAMGHVTQSRVQRRTAQIVEALGLPPSTRVYTCMHHPRGKGRWAEAKGCARRKPSPAMLLEALADHDMEPGQMIYVGDRISDRQAARAARVRFQWADRFFGA